MSVLLSVLAVLTVQARQVSSPRLPCLGPAARIGQLHLLAGVALRPVTGLGVKHHGEACNAGGKVGAGIRRAIQV